MGTCFRLSRDSKCVVKSDKCKLSDDIGGQPLCRKSPIFLLFVILRLFCWPKLRSRVYNVSLFIVEIKVFVLFKHFIYEVIFCFEGFDFGDEEEWGDTSHNEDTNTTLTETDTILRNASPMDGDRTKKSAITKTKGLILFCIFSFASHPKCYKMKEMSWKLHL